jgi:hypothetical protein
MFPLTLNIFERGSGGVPGSTVFTHVRGRRVKRYTQATSARFGFESMSCGFRARKDEAQEWLANGLMRTVVVYDPDSLTTWEGYLSRVDAAFGEEKRSRSLDGVANRIRVRYTSLAGVGTTTATGSDTISQALYGTRDYVHGIGTAAAADATNLRSTILAERKNPRMRPASDIADRNLPDWADVTLTFAGWYDTLGWLILDPTGSNTSSATTTQVGTLLTNAAAINAFVGTSTVDLTASGLTATEYRGQELSYRTRIEQLLQLGNSSGQRHAWGVYENRRMTVAQWAGATPSTIHYRRRLGSNTLMDTAGQRVPPWRARPNKMYEVPDLLDVAPVSTAQDAAARFFVERVMYEYDGQGSRLRLEPTDVTSLDAVLARFQ